MLFDALRGRLGARAGSFRLMGEDLALVGVDELRAAVAASDAALARLAPAVRDELLAEERALAGEAHRWLTRYNRSVHARLAGYLELGTRCEFAYPWPVVAILGVQQVITAMNQNRVWGLAGRAAARFGWGRYERLADRSEDVLRRTNRGIFADSVPTVLRVLRADALRAEGKVALADALVDGVANPLWDDELRALARVIADGLAIADPGRRFTALAAATLRHFGREQAIFTHHMGVLRDPPPGGKRPEIRDILGPAIERGRGGKRLVWKRYPLPPGFDLRDHDARVRELGAAFVTSVTRDPDDYRVATAWVVTRLSRANRR
jgi:hypothetical protein